MHTNNSKVKNTIVSVYFILMLLAIVFTTIFKSFSEFSENPSLKFLFMALGFAGLFFIVHFISKYFEYDSDGLKVVVINKGLLLSDKYNYRERRLEFAKDELYAFKFKNYIVYRTLTFYVKDKRQHKTKETFNITLVSKRKRRYIRQSLSKMIKMNTKDVKIKD